MSKSHEDAEEIERAELKILVRQALAKIQRLEEQATALREENARLKRLRARLGQISRGR
jgi:small-conductance mechanosensitive channel